jgi:hypothetical protein
MSTRTETDDVVALWRLQSAYADVITRRAWADLEELFLPDTEVHVDTVTTPPRTFVGPSAFGDFVAGAIARFDHFAFVILNTVVELDPAAAGGEATTARGRIFMCEVRHDEATDSWQNAHGVYQDRYRHLDGRWWFADRRYRSMARTGPGGEVLGLPPDLPPIGWVRSGA